VSLISRLYDVSSGRVLLDGADVREVDLRSLRQAVAVVSDDPFLFSETVAENIAYARVAGLRSRASRSSRPPPRPGPRVHRAPARRLRHRVGERGLTLSGASASAWRSRGRYSRTRAC